MMKPKILILSLLPSLLLSLTAARSADTGPAALTVWDLQVGAHARQLPQDAFIDYACGTNGGPPSIVLNGWTEFAKCPAEPATGYHEVYFRYDDEAEFVTRAKFDPQLSDQSTSAYNIPVIVSALFDDAGFMVGYRMFSDPRVDDNLRAIGSVLSSPLRARYGEDKFVCEDLPRAQGESEFQGIYAKRRCRQTGAPGGLDLLLEYHQFRKAGQAAVDVDGPTKGLFESTTSFQALLSAGIPDQAQRLAKLPEPTPSPKDILIARARNCAGCDLRGADLKRANLTGANLAGADLTGADLHGAILAGADLSAAQLLNANINRADLRRAKLPGALLAGAMLFATRFDGADVSSANLDGVYAGKAQFSVANASNVSAVDADLRNARLNDANFAGANLSGALLDDVQMTRSVLAGAILTQASMWRTNLVGADLSRVDARGADLFGANLRESDLTSANFSQARLSNANLTSAKTFGTKFNDATLPAGYEPAR